MKDWGKVLPWALLPIALAQYSGLWLPYHSAKWMLLYFVSFCVLPVLFFYRPVYPKLSRWEWLGFFSVVLATLGHLFWFKPDSYEFSLLDRMSFLILLFAFWRGFSERLTWEHFKNPLLILMALISGVGLGQFLLTGRTAEMPYFSMAAMQGHTNLSSQLVGLCLVLFVSLFSETYFVRNRSKFIGLIGFVLLYIVVARGRSVILALALVGILALVQLVRTQRKFPWKLVFGGLASIYFLIVGLQLAQNFSLSDSLLLTLFTQKSGMFTFRLDVWTQTWKMIQAYPLGVGVDRFVFSFIPFHRLGHSLSYVNVATNPHNEFLRYLAEDGVVLSALFLSSILWIVWKARAHSRNLKMLALPLLFLLSEMAVQFPFEIAPVVFLSAAIFGFVLSRIYPAQKSDPNVPLNFVLGLVCLVFLALVTKAFASRLWERSTLISEAKISCEWAPGNWNSCLNYGRLLTKDLAFTEARKVVEAVLERDPWNYAALRHMSFLALKQNDLLESCFFMWKYDDLFRGESDLKEIYQRNCPVKWKDYFKRKRPKKFYGRAKAMPPPEMSGPDGKLNFKRPSPLNFEGAKKNGLPPLNIPNGN